MKLLALILACLALGLVAAGCGDDDEDSGGGDAANTQQPAETGSAGGGGGGAKSGGGAERKAAEVSMKDIQFQPGEVSVPKGGTVTWTNDDSVGHDVTADGFKSGDPGAMQQGDSFEHSFRQAGSFDYVCSVHPGMEGTVEVK